MKDCSKIRCPFNRDTFEECKIEDCPYYTKQLTSNVYVSDRGNGYLHICEMTTKKAFMVDEEKLTQIKEEMCDHYCKMPEFYLSQYKDPDEAHEIMVNECCAKCPLERLNK